MRKSKAERKARWDKFTTNMPRLRAWSQDSGWYPGAMMDRFREQNVHDNIDTFYDNNDGTEWGDPPDGYDDDEGVGNTASPPRIVDTHTIDRSTNRRRTRWGSGRKSRKRRHPSATLRRNSHREAWKASGDRWRTRK